MSEKSNLKNWIESLIRQYFVGFPHTQVFLLGVCGLMLTMTILMPPHTSSSTEATVQDGGLQGFGFMNANENVMTVYRRSSETK